MRDPIRHAQALACAALLVAIAACGGGSSGAAGGTPPPSAPAIPPTGNSLPGPRPVAEPEVFANFETGPVRPLALSLDGTRLFAVNTPDNRLEVFTNAVTPTPLFDVPVGLEPVAVAEAPDGRVWVVNHLSDSVSVVDVDAVVPHVVQTLWVGDEPRDIVFAGPGRARAFVTTAHRGQNSPVDPALNTPGTGRADVWVFDSAAVDDRPGGTPLEIVTLFGDRPRPLAVSPDGGTVYAGIFLSGNRTTAIAPSNLPKPGPGDSADGVPAPDSGLILRYDGSRWVDERGAAFDGSVPFSLPDFDVFAIDAATLAQTATYSGVGTILFDIAVNPVSGTLYVSNLDSRNHVRFAGAATRAATTVRGRVSDQRITVIDAGGVRPRLLNKHVDFDDPANRLAERALSLSMPMGLAVSSNGNRLYVAAFGSARLGVFDTADLQTDRFMPAASGQVALSAGGPSGIVLDEANGRAFVATRFDNGISTIDLARLEEIAHLRMFSPEPTAVVAGRPFLYDADRTSGNGNDSCASCHLFGDTDGLAWDLGEPDKSVAPVENVFIPISPAAAPFQFHPMKGPMTTQSMRGLEGHGPMHWRGDRSGSERAPGETLEEAAFKEFNEAFDAFFALEGELDDADMQAFTDFAMTIRYPPNPIRPLDNRLRGIAVDGERLFETGVVRIQTGQREICVQCHTLDPAAGLFGTRGLMSDNSQAGERNFKIPHFRDQYQKVGMFGWGFNSPPATGPQVRGFSFNHNGATSSNFIIADLGMPTADLLALREFLYSFPTESPAVTGQQLTLSTGNRSQAAARLDLLVDRGRVELPVPECDLVAKGVIDDRRVAFYMDRDGLFGPDSSTEAPLTRAAFEALLVAPSDRLTLTCVPWGSGPRIGIDRDADGVPDRG